MRPKAFVLICFLLASKVLFAQVNNATWVGMAKGAVRDSLNNYGVPSATLAVYRDTVLLNFALSDHRGEFSFGKLPVGTELKIVVTSVNYKTLSKIFRIDPNVKNIDLKHLNLNENTRNLDEVEIRAVPPIRMNGDTLEFNAAAFKLAPNSVAEDLLKKLPGIIMWGDGTITFNGKEIKRLIVNGKPFFAGDTKVATQNIPNDAIDKVQVYRTDFDQNKPLDTVTELNLKLRKEKSFGYFGKASGGLASKNRYDYDLSLNIFSPTLQVGIVGALNNTNKIAPDVATVMRNSTFKGVGANAEYQSRLGLEGLTNHRAIGAMFQKDFILSPNNANSSMLAGDFFIVRNDRSLNKITDVTVGIGENIRQATNSTNDNQTEDTNENFSVKYERKKQNVSFLVSGELKVKHGIENVNQQDSVSNSELGNQSTRTLLGDAETKWQELRINSELLHARALDSERALADWKINYDFITRESSEESSNLTDFRSFINPAKSTRFNREINAKQDFTEHNLRVKFGDFYRYLFGPSARGITINLKNNFRVNEENIDQEVYDETNDQRLVPNNDISNRQRSRVINEVPSISLSKSIVKQLSGRYQKSLTATFDLAGQLYELNSISDKMFQNLDYSYTKFVPQANIQYTHDRDGRFQNLFELSYIQSYNYPSIAQLAPVVDRSQIYDIRQGNLDLRPSRQQNLNFRLNHKNFRTKNTFGYSLSMNLGVVKDNFSDFISIDSNAVTTIGQVNLNGHRYLNILGAVNKAYKFKKSQLQVKLDNSFGISRVPSLIKNFNDDIPNLIFNNNFSAAVNIRLYYAIGDGIAANLVQSASLNYSVQDGPQDNSFYSSLYVTTFGIEKKLSKKMAIASNLDYNNAGFSGLQSTDFLIWNANVYQRFMKGNNLEVKFSALDILRQNKGITTFSANNMVRLVKVNALQQYFMLTLSYFPRKFGKKA